MPTYELTLSGYDHETDKTDDLIKWVSAPSREALDVWLRRADVNWLLQEPVDQSVNEMDQNFGDLEIEDGVDVAVSETGRVIRGDKVWLYWHRQIAILSSKTEINNQWEGRLIGKHGDQVVYLNGQKFDCNQSLRVVNHSPDGFSWGYCGSGPSQLALAILLEETGDVNYAVAEYNEFMRREIAIQDKDEGFHMTTKQVKAYIESRRREQKAFGTN